ncbi:hypothetical protein SynA1560_00083 [Synechococcus sp. A15-60]|nr:hypothetical protein SynA1560_00083 [Synechococcus sp. A15-60]
MQIALAEIFVGRCFLSRMPLYRGRVLLFVIVEYIVCDKAAG